MDHLGRRERVQFEGGISLLDCAEQIFVPRQGQVRIVTALQQQLRAADGNRLVDLAKQLLEAEYVSLRGTDGAIERAEVTFRNADVRVVDVAIDDRSEERRVG